MNVFIIPKNQEVNRDILTAVALSAFLGSEMDVEKDCIRCELGFSLNNINANVFEQLVFSSTHQNVIEDFDKPIIEQGNIVVVAVPQSQLGTARQNFDNYAQITNFFQKVDNNGEQEEVHCLIGVANQSNTDFFEPLKGFTSVAFHANQIDEISQRIGSGDAYIQLEAERAIEDLINNGSPRTRPGGLGGRRGFSRSTRRS